MIGVKAYGIAEKLYGARETLLNAWGDEYGVKMKPLADQFRRNMQAFEYLEN